MVSDFDRGLEGGMITQNRRDARLQSQKIALSKGLRLVKLGHASVTRSIGRFDVRP